VKDVTHHLCSLLASEANTELDSLSATEWDALAREASRGGVAPLAFWMLSTAGKISALPQSARDALRQSYAATWKHNREIFDELETLAGEFQRADISLVLLKGACFALTIYPDPGTRPMGDLDLLVPVAKWEQAAGIAKTCGYAEAYPEAAPGLSELLNHDVCLKKKTVTLEIHRSLLADKTFKYAVPVDWFWTQTQPLNDARFPAVLILSPAAQLLYAAAHAMLQHGGKNAALRWFVDMERLIRLHKKELDWAALLAQAKVFEWGSALAAALEQTQAHFNTPIPENIRAELSAHTDRHRGMVRELQKKPLTHTQQELQKMGKLNMYGKLRLFLALVFPSPAYMRWRYDLKTSLALPIYYPLRWWGIFGDGLRTLIALVRRQTP
jgi:hypothetical protein